MKQPRVEIGRVNLRLQGGQWSPREAEKMARLMIRHLQDELAAREQAPRGARAIPQISPGPVRIAPGDSAAAAAQKTAAQICRSLGEN